ncbi:serine/threonine protein kinase [Carboxylicivirga caseinilyticus]|uniref:serine/threonine protein kinase n=1 Tax=Carboxylicivirga caseinilyticus TaxID=3417572 RepID=UPI003D343375|nr:protein kinase [Marinilabiliaceae bacterium A049]
MKNKSMDLKILSANYKIEEQISNGLFIGSRKTDNRKVMIKKAKHKNHGYLESFERFSQIHHHSIANTLELINDSGDLYVVREYHQGTSLKTILDTRSIYHKVSERFFIQLTIELLKTVDLLHQSNVLHLDLKPANIIIKHKESETPSEWKPENILLIDFEQSLCFPVEKGLRNRFTLIYSPPEQLLNRLHLLKPSSDISAIGILLYEMIAGSAPYCDCNPEMLLHLQLTYPIKKRPTMRDEFFEIIHKASYKSPFPKPPRMLDYDTIDDILSKGINERYQSCGEMITALNNYLELIKDYDPSWWHKMLRRLGF